MRKSFDLMPFLLLLVAILASACAELQWAGAGFSPKEQASWTAEHFSLEEASAWHQRRFDTSAATAFREAGVVNPSEAARWSVVTRQGRRSAAIHDRHFSDPVWVATEWRGAGFSPDDALPWLLVRVRGDGRWEGEAISAAEARSWKAHDFSAGDAQGWIDAHITPDEAQRWRTANIPRKVAEEWRQAGFSYEEASKWRGAGFDRNQAQQWKELPLPPGVAQSWRQGGFRAQEAKEWLDFSVEDAVAWRANEFSRDEAIAWRRAGFDPGQANATRLQHIHNACPERLTSFVDLIRTNPYDTKGHCYQVVATPLQLLSRTSGLYSVVGSTLYLDFGSKSAQPVLFNGICRGTGAFRYRTLDGASAVVPRLRVIPDPRLPPRLSASQEGGRESEPER
jgi:hypothetical protein